MDVREEKTDIEGFVVLSLLWFVPVSVPVLSFLLKKIFVIKQ